MLVSDAIEDVRRLLFSGQREERNILSAQMLSNATTLTCTYPLGSIARGSKLSIELEDMYVWDKSSLTVSPIHRGQWGTTAVTHAAGTVIHVNPKFSNYEIYKALADEIISLGSPATGLYYVATTELAYNPVISGYNFADNSILDVLEVQYSIPGPSREYPHSQDWELSRAMSDEFTDETAIFVRDAYPTSTVLVKGKFGFSPLAAALSTDFSTTNLWSTMYDIPIIGAAWRLASRREVRRNFDEVQGDTRRADEVPPGANLGGARELYRLRQERIREEAIRLSQQFPTHSHRYPYAIR